MEEKKRGRPPLPEEEKKQGTQIGVRMELEERELFNRAAKLDGRTTSNWIRQVCLKEAERVLAQSKKSK